MFKLFDPLTKYIKIKPVSTYNLIFLLHSKFTVAILLTFSVLISAKQFFGDPIYCKSDDTKNVEYLNNFCWTLGTFIQEEIRPGSGIIRPNSYISYGIGPKFTGKKIYIRYYQWIVLILVMQAISFLIPSFLWKNWEGGRLQQLCDGAVSVVIEDEIYNQKKKILVRYFTSNYRDIHACYTLKYVLCEILNLLITILNMLSLDIIFNGFWFKYLPVIDIITSYDWDEWNNKTSVIFPKQTKCNFTSYGPSGSKQNIDGLCLLPLNILNEKIFAFLYCWLLFLAIISSLQILYRTFVLLSKKLRLLLVRAQARELKSSEIRRALTGFNFGDWFILFNLSKNINPILFRDLIHELLLKTKNAEKIDA